MDADAEEVEVSLFDYIEQKTMARGRIRRWRDTRDTLPARRRRRTIRRRDFARSKEYAPFEVDARCANRGVQARLLGGILGALLFLGCLLSVVLSPAITLGSVFAISVGISSLGLSMALIMSARREEIVHQVASELVQDMERRKRLEAEELSTQDGSLLLTDQSATDPLSVQWSWDGEEVYSPR